jgi:uncharacterized membrane protein
MFEVITLAAIVYAVINIGRLKDRVRKLEQGREENAAGPEVVSVSAKSSPKRASAVQTGIIPVEEIPRPADSSTASVASEDDFGVTIRIEAFFTWLREDWPMKLGGILVLIGFGWFVTYAFMNNWVGPVGRVTIGLVAGAAFIPVGFFRIRSFNSQGGVLLVIGSTIILLTTFAARSVYNMLDPTSGLAMMFLSTAFVAFASVKYRSRALAICSLFLSFVAPLLTNSPATDHVGLFAYLLAVVLGSIWIVALTGYRELTTIALACVWLYSAPHLTGLASTVDTLLLFAFAFSAVFFLSNVAAIMKMRDGGVVFDAITAIGNGAFLLLWIFAVVDKEWQSLVIVAWMLVFAFGTFLINRVTERREPFFVYIGVFIAFLAAATAAELDGNALTIAYTLEAAILPIVTYFILKDIRMTMIASILMAIPGLMSLPILLGDYLPMDDYASLMVILIYGLALAGLATFLKFALSGKESDHRDAILLNNAQIFVGAAFLLGSLWHALHMWFIVDTATMIALVAYTIFGIALYLVGKNTEKKFIRISGTILLACVMARLFLYEVWSMALVGRVITFLTVGGLLIATAFMNKKNQ